MTDHPKSWRDVIKVHPAADLFPMMSPDELKALGEDIRKNGLTTPIVLWGVLKESWPHYSLLDGRNRLDAMEAAGLSLVDDKGELNLDKGVLANKHDIVASYRYEGLATVPSGIDPYDYVLSANLHRRHLTAEQKREIVAKMLKARPAKSNRTIAKQAKVDHKTVASVRAEKQATGEIPQLNKTVGVDGKARTTALKKKRRDIDDKLAENRAKTAAKATDALARQQPDNPPDHPLVAAWQMAADDTAKLPFVVYHRDQIVAAFAKRDDACDWARYRSVNFGCRCAVSTVKGVLNAFEDGQSVDT